MIKKIFQLALILSFTTSLLFAQLPVEIKGLLIMNKIVPVKLFKVVKGIPVEIQNINPAPNGEFSITFNPDYEGFYLIGTGTAYRPDKNYKFYFKGGEKLSFSILDSNYVLNGKSNSKENELMSKWHNFVNPLELKAYYVSEVKNIFVDFFPLLEEITLKSKVFLTQKSIGNIKFDKLMKDNIAWDLASYASNFIGKRPAYDLLAEQYSPYYAKLKAQNFSKSVAITYGQPWGERTLDALIALNKKQQNLQVAGGIEALRTRLNFISNDTLKGDFVLALAKNIIKEEEFQSLMTDFGKYLVTKEQLEKKANLLNKLVLAKVELPIELQTGKPAFAFSYPDKNGKTIAMADLKGKVVLIDIWATWCGPCKAEIPYLKKLEEEMKGTDLQVVSISVDEAKDKQKWLEIIKNENLSGLQLFASGWGEIAKYYQIKGIPRFMVFDREGKIVTVDAPIPSDPKLKGLLEKTLSAK